MTPLVTTNGFWKTLVERRKRTPVAVRCWPIASLKPASSFDPKRNYKQRDSLRQSRHRNGVNQSKDEERLGT